MGRAGHRLPAVIATGLAAVVIALLVVVTGGALGRGSVDPRIVAAAHRLVLHHHVLLTAARAATTLGAPIVVDVAAVLVALLLWVAQRRLEAGFVIGVRVVTLLVDTGLKAAVARPRPAFRHATAHASGASFPSGHAAGAASLYFPVALVLGALLASTAARYAVMALALLTCVVVATTRVLLGVHYPSDVLAGLALGAAVTAAGWQVTDTLRARFRNKPEMSIETR